MIHQGGAVMQMANFTRQALVQKPTARDWACVSRMGGFGDNLIASSVFPGLKKKYGFLEVITAEPMHIMFENNPYIDKLSVHPAGRDKDPAWGWNDEYHLRSRENKFFANLSHSCEATGVFMKVQTQFWWPDKMRRKVCDKSYLEIVHDICDIPYAEIHPDFFPTDAEKDQAAETKGRVGGKVIGWVLTGSRFDKIHPNADVAIARIIRELGIPVMMFGAPGKDLEYARLIEKEVRKHNRSIDGLHLCMSPDGANPTWGPRRICTQAQSCDLVVTPDTGPAWSVAMHDMPKVMMSSHAGATNVTKHWKNTTTLAADPERVPCFPCHRLHDDISLCHLNVDGNGAACISDISVEQLVETVTKLAKD